ncbi:MAG: hypothetical protein DCC75_09715, partial [Proteobacteria bacterium]
VQAAAQLVVAAFGNDALERVVLGEVRTVVEQPAIELTYTLLDFGDRSGTARAAQELLTSANFQFNRTVQQVVYQVHRRFFALAAAQGAVEANKHSKDDAEQSMRVAQKGFEVGIRPKSDLLLAESSLRRAEFQLASSSATLERSRAGLAEVLGVQIGPDLEILTPDLNALHSAFAPSDRKVSDLIESALSKRPDLLSTYAEARAADADIDVIIGKALPRLVTRMNASVTETNGSTDEEKNYDLGIGVEVPLFTGFSYYYALRKAEAERDRSMQLARQGQLSVASQVWSAFFNSKAAEDQVASAEALLGASQESQRVLLRGYQEGSSSLLDLLTAQTSLALARQTMIAAQADWAVSIAELALACGELKPEPVLTK